MTEMLNLYETCMSMMLWLNNQGTANQNLRSFSHPSNAIRLNSKTPLYVNQSQCLTI